MQILFGAFFDAKTIDFRLKNDSAVQEKIVIYYCFPM